MLYQHMKPGYRTVVCVQFYEKDGQLNGSIRTCLEKDKVEIYYLKSLKPLKYLYKFGTII